MVIAIEHLVDLLTEPSQREELLRRFLVAALYTITYAPDRKAKGAFRRLRKQLRAHFKYAAETQEALENEFLSYLYTDRAERQEIEDLLPAMRLVLVHGLIGVGKTVVLKKIQANYDREGPMKFIYIDLKAIPGLLESATEISFSTRLEQVVYHLVYNDYVARSGDRLREWRSFKVCSDPGFVAIKEWILELAQRPLPSQRDWDELLSQEAVQDKLLSLDVRPELATLLLFVKEEVPLVLCFDNVDRYPVETQREVFSKCIDISNQVEIPVIVAIRERNLRRIIDEGARGDPVLVDYFERLETGDEETVLIEEIPVASLKQLLEKRFSFMERHDAFGTLQIFFEQSSSEDDELDFKEYERRFWNLYQIVSDTFVDRDVYRYCNYNIRQMLIFYFRFISKMLLNPEEEYRAERLIRGDLSANITKLRNYFYKWLICADSLVPKTEAGFPNIYEHLKPHLHLTNLRILEFLRNWESSNPDSKICFGEMASVFKRFGVKRKALGRQLVGLSKSNRDHELGLIWLDVFRGSPTTDETRIELLPAGEYFLDVVSVSREYAFWSALTADLEIDLVGQRITLADTYKDDFKLEVLYEFARQILVPALAEELVHYETNLQVPKGWRAARLDYLKRHFSDHGHFYVDRLLNSVMDSIPYSHLPVVKQNEINRKYFELLRAVEEFEGKR